MWDCRESQSVLGLEEGENGNPRGWTGSSGPTASPGLGLGEVGKSVRTSEQRVRAPCLLDLGTHSGGWADWHPQVWFLAGVAAAYSGTQTHSPGGRGGKRSVGQGNPTSHSHFPSSQPYPPEPNQDPVGLGPGPLLIGSQEVLHHGDAPARATGGGPRVRLVLCRAACLPSAPGPPLTAPQGSAPRPAGSWGSTRSWPEPASGSPGCLPGQATPQQVPGMILVPMPYSHLGGNLCIKWPAWGATLSASPQALCPAPHQCPRCVCLQSVWQGWRPDGSGSPHSLQSRVVG